jgi:predicted nucleic acid-binding protein
LIALLDTNVVSELFKPQPNPNVIAFYDSLAPDAIFLSVMTIGEISKGIERLEEGSKRRELLEWRNTIERDYAIRILPIDSEVAQIWGEITAQAKKLHVDLPVVDGLIAATALRHGMHVITRNTKDFEITKALTINPWQG